MENLILIFFLIIIVSTIFVYRLVQSGSVSLFLFKDNLSSKRNYILAEKVRLAQVCFGYSYFLFHSLIIWGVLNTFLFFSFSFILSLVFEIIGVKTGYVFGKFMYIEDNCPGPIIIGVPFVIPIAWSGLLYMSINVSILILGLDINNIAELKNLDVIIISSTLITLLDFVLDPLAVNEGRWKWLKPGKYYGVPMKNYFGWFFNSTIIFLTFSLFISPFSITNNYTAYFNFSPSILFVLLPAIAARPCIERGLKFPGIFGLIFSLLLIVIIFIF